jgi:hypothetical protein
MNGEAPIPDSSKRMAAVEEAIADAFDDKPQPTLSIGGSVDLKDRGIEIHFEKKL